MTIADRVAALRPTYLLYLLASGAALAADVALFLLLLRLSVAPALASGLGYAGGIVVHWLLSSRMVFTAEIAADRRARAGQQALFLASAAIGLGISVAIVGLGSALALDPRLAKLAAIAASFQAVWLLRRHLVFAR